MSELMKLQPTILHFTKMLSLVLKVDIEIIDSDLVRVAGTGPYGKNFGQKLNTSSRLFRYVLDTKEEKVVIKPRIDALCTDCKDQGCCKESAFLGVPILMNERCIGVISLVAFTAKQQAHIRDNVQTFSSYVRHIAQVFVTNIIEDNKGNTPIDSLFISLIENMDQGVLVLNDNNFVQFGNQKALDILNLTSEKINSTPINITSASIDNHDLEGHQQHVIAFDDHQELVLGLFHNIQGQKLFLMAFNQPNNAVKTDLPKALKFDSVIGECQQMQAIKRLIGRIAKSPSSVLINGESGTGKEVIAKAIHINSERQDHPFIAINCAAIPEQLLESELFGYVKGAFTGASSKGKIGLIQAANSGTLFLDEIGDMSMTLQAKLLRVLEEREVMPIGANKSVPVNIRVLSATNRDFSKMIEEGNFREDLYYRLNVIPIFLPPLRERAGDIDKLLVAFLKAHSRRLNIPVPPMTSTVENILNAYKWPGNVRELSNLIEYLTNVVPEGEPIDTDLLPPYISSIEVKEKPVSNINIIKTYSQTDETLQDIEAEKIKETLLRVKNRKLAAAELGIGVATLYRKIKKYELNSIKF
ncbi:sigma 54-interacting transcriptional regulator [Vibrio sp. SS-MA-C1-2]|uniref:sigma-54 interaction domain-containing protein n=1 Tax=Vibrio sp. SS-MA-C1-2 TaxID=2908646 RepID=UPI001F346D38|nr:sigma 54-interacting transcriptional regulator [Vibrio sp. SS-MA-C1-2]UJF18277.1 sigma 54-interacting transcriptional regulator [Vibrio sp. SS-MA-C1-2]